MTTKHSGMKLLILIFIFIAVACNSISTNSDAQISFLNKEQDWGTLSYKKPQTKQFVFSNPGDQPLVILDVKTSCGCTDPQWTSKPVKPGKTGSIDITYDSDFPGRFRKTITVFYNGKNSPDTLTIKGEVAYPEEMN